jgi:hypothetical protein
VIVDGIEADPVCKLQLTQRMGVAKRIVFSTDHQTQIVLNWHCLWRQGSSERFLASGKLFLINPDEAVDLTYSHDSVALRKHIKVS